MLKAKNLLYTAGLFILGIIIGVGGTLLVQHIRGPKQTVTVTGQGVVEAPADQADINVTIQTTSWSQDQAQKDNKEEVQDLRDKLISLGIPESRIIQSSYNAIPLPMMVPDQAVPPGIINGNMPLPLPGGSKDLNVSTSLSITLDNLQGIDRIFTAINASPDAKITNSYYSLKSTAPYEAQAREKALQDTRNQVESIARINNLHVGKLLWINNISNPIPMYKDAAGGVGRTSVTNSVSYGEKTINVTASFNAQYELD